MWIFQHCAEFAAPPPSLAVGELSLPLIWAAWESWLWWCLCRRTVHAPYVPCGSVGSGEMHPSPDKSQFQPLPPAHLLATCDRLATWPCWQGCRKTDGLTTSGSTKAHIQGFDLAHTDIHLISKLLESMNGLVLPIQSSGIPRTQGNKRLTERSPSLDPVLTA